MNDMTSGPSSSDRSKAYPKDAMVTLSLLEEMGISSHEPRVVNQLLEFIYRYVTCICEEARAYSAYAKKKMIDINDIKLAIKIIADKSSSTVPPREMLLDVAKQKNMVPLPLLKNSSGLRLPPDRVCLTQPNYQLQFYKRAIASTVSEPVQYTRLPGTSNIFKTPQVPISSSSSNLPATTSSSSPPPPPIIPPPSRSVISVAETIDDDSVVTTTTVKVGQKRKIDDVM